MQNTTQSSNDVMPFAFTGRPINSVARVVFVTLGSIMIICGVIGNWLLISVVFTNFQKRRKRYVHNLFIFNLALADLLTVGYWLTFFVFDLILGHHPVAGPKHCIANGIVIATLSVVSTTSLVTISLNRYLHVCHSHLYNRVFTLPRTVCFCILIWIFGFVLALPPLFGAEAGSYHYNPETRICSYNRDKVTYPKVMVILFCVAPMLFVGYWNFAIVRFWKKARKSISTFYPKFHNKRQKRDSQTDISKRHKKSKNEFTGNDEKQTERTGDEGTNSDSHMDVPTIRVEDFSDIHNSAFIDTDMSESRDAVFESAAGEVNLSDNESGRNVSQSTSSDKSAAGEEKIDRRSTLLSDSAAGIHCTELTENSGQAKDPAVKEVSSRDKEEHSEGVPSNQMPDIAQILTERGTELSSQSAGRTRETDTMTTTTTVAASAAVITGALLSPSSTLLRGRARCKSQKRLNPTLQRLKRERKKRKGREKAFVRSLFVVCLLMFLSFIPYGICTIVYSFVAVPPEAIIAGIMLFFAKNAVNWIVYGVMNTEFRRGYAKYFRRLLLVCCHWKSRKANMFSKASQNSLSTICVQTSNANCDDGKSCISET